MMQHIQGTQCHQLQMNSLESKIASENPVRFLDAFVEHISLESVGFAVQSLRSESRPSCDSKVFFKIYLYGYLNGLRSSKTAKNITNSNKIQ
jgi:transposase